MNSLLATERKKAADIISRWLDGELTNHQMDDDWPWKSEDLAVVHIGGELWTLFDDFPESRLDISDLNSDDVELLRRCLAFLESGEEYEPVPREQSEKRKGMVAKLVGFASRQVPEASPLNIPVARRQWWPFADEEQWRKVSSH